MHSCQLYIFDMHIRHVNYNENYKLLIFLQFLINVCQANKILQL